MNNFHIILKINTIQKYLSAQRSIVAEVREVILELFFVVAMVLIACVAYFSKKRNKLKENLKNETPYNQTINREATATLSPAISQPLVADIVEKSVCEAAVDVSELSETKVDIFDPTHGHEKIHVPLGRSIKGQCYVIDGDTIKIGATKIRLAGVDAPELDMPWGQKSKWAMVKLTKGEVITVELTGDQSHDRLVGTCYLSDGRDVGAELIKLGLALDYTQFSGGKYKHLEPKGARRKLKYVYTRERQQERA